MHQVIHISGFRPLARCLFPLTDKHMHATLPHLLLSLSLPSLSPSPPLTFHYSSPHPSPPGPPLRSLITQPIPFPPLNLMSLCMMPRECKCSSQCLLPMLPSHATTSHTLLLPHPSHIPLHSHLMSLCMMFSECKCLRPLSTPRRMYLALPRTRPASSLSSLKSKK